MCFGSSLRCPQVEPFLGWAATPFVCAPYLLARVRWGLCAGASLVAGQLRAYPAVSFLQAGQNPVQLLQACSEWDVGVALIKFWQFFWAGFFART